MEATITGATLRLVLGDITQQDTDAIVNAANSSLAGGGGVDGAIHRAGGPEISEQCDMIRRQQGPCPTGQAVITTGGRLRARHVIHAVGPVWHGGEGREDELLASAYRASLKLAVAHGLHSVSFPSISTGAYRFPVRRAARIALVTARDFLREVPGKLAEVRFVLFSKPDYDAYEEAFREVILGPGS